MDATRKIIRYCFCVILLGAFVQGCAGSEPETRNPNAIKVEIVVDDGGYQLLRGGEPYQIKGAGLEYGDIISLAAHGGNSIRTWSTKNETETAAEVLDKALENGVTVALCLRMGVEHWGFDYDDADAVRVQFEEMRREVLKYRDHPALLVWIIGNELNYDYTNPKVYDAVNDVSKMIHALDPNHPTTTTIAGLNAEALKDIHKRATDLDFVSFQVYGELVTLPDFIERSAYDKPFFVTEWGAIGHWEVDKTSWGAPIEATSSQKAETYLNGYRERLETVEGKLVGSYAFLWGQKQERTSTWFGLFTEAGEETETVDVMHYIWNGSWPDNRSPKVSAFSLNGMGAEQNVMLRVGQSYDATVEIIDHERDALTYRWEIKPESDATQVGGDFEQDLESLDQRLISAASAQVEITAPPIPGAYRLYVYANDGHGHAAHANIPFYVNK